MATFPSVFLKTRGLHYFYSVSYLYFGAMATVSVVLVGLLVSYVKGEMIQTAGTRKLLMHDDVSFRNSLLHSKKKKKRKFNCSVAERLNLLLNFAPCVI